MLDCCVGALVKCRRGAHDLLSSFVTILVLFVFWYTDSALSDVHVNKVLVGDLICTRFPKWASKVWI